MRDHCRPNPCYHGGFCTPTETSIGNYTCGCSPGWKGPTCVGNITDDTTDNIKHNILIFTLVVRR